jgi:hypothetical protein
MLLQKLTNARNGHVMNIKSPDIVVGDLVNLEEGVVVLRIASNLVLKII